MKRVILAAAVLASPATAQSTICTPYLNGVECDQQPAGIDPSTLMGLSQRGGDAGQAFTNSYNAAREAATRRQMMQLETQRQQQELAQEQARQQAANAVPNQVGQAPYSILSREQLIHDVAVLVSRRQCSVAEQSLRELKETELLQRTIEPCLATASPQSGPRQQGQ